jgi:hypothetical protein
MTGWHGLVWILLAIGAGWTLGRDRATQAERRIWDRRARAHRIRWHRQRKEEE